MKVHRYHERFHKELATYRRLAERKIVRLKGFEFPQLVNYDEELHILELSIVSPPCILDFVEVGLGKKPGNFDQEPIEAQQSKQFGNDWPEGEASGRKELIGSLFPSYYVLSPLP